MQGFIITKDGEPLGGIVYRTAQAAADSHTMIRAEYPGEFDTHRVLSAKIVVDQPERWCNLETHEIDVSTDYGELENWPAEFDVDRERGDPSVGDSKWVARAEFYRAKLGSLTITRDMLCDMLGKAAVEEIEDRISEECAASGQEYEDAAE